MDSGYTINYEGLQESLKYRQLPYGIKEALRAKIIEISKLQNPRSIGGKSKNKDNWIYPVGTFQLLCKIDNSNRIIYIIKLIQLP